MNTAWEPFNPEKHLDANGDFNFVGFVKTFGNSILAVGDINQSRSYAGDFPISIHLFAEVINFNPIQEQLQRGEHVNLTIQAK